MLRRMLLGVLCLCLCGWSTYAFYVPGTTPNEFDTNDTLPVLVNSLFSHETVLPVEYYSLPVCQPAQGVHQSKSFINPGTILSGMRIYNSPYEFRMMIEERSVSACPGMGHSEPLTVEAVEYMKQLINKRYRLRFVLDNLPVTTNDLAQRSVVLPGVELGFKAGEDYYVHNHMVFNVLVHRTHGEYRANAARAMTLVDDTDTRNVNVATQTDSTAATSIAGGTAAGMAAGMAGQAQRDMWMVVGFEVLPCSLRRDAGQVIEKLTCGMPGAVNNPPPQKLEVGSKIVYSYDVYFQESSITWSSRWDAYLTMAAGPLHWYSVVDSIMVVMVLAGVAAVVIARTVRRDLQKYEDLLLDSEGQDESGWKLVSGDVFRPPQHAATLAVQAGSGAQVLAAVLLTIFVSMLGFLSPAWRGSLVTALIVLYMMCGIVAGFVATSLWCYITQSHTNWLTITFKAVSFYPSIVAAVLLFLNVVLRVAAPSASMAAPLSTLCMLALMWLAVAVPLAFCGGVLAVRLTPTTKPCRVNQVARHIPPPNNLSQPWLLAAIAGVLPFGTLYVELSFAMASMWLGFYYYLYGVAFIVMLLAIVIAAEASILTTYMQLCAEDHRWWWSSFYRGGAVAWYVAVYGVLYLFITLNSLSGPVSMAMYAGYMAIMCFGLYLSMAFVGLATSLCFVHFIFSSVKAE